MGREWRLLWQDPFGRALASWVPLVLIGILCWIFSAGLARISRSVWWIWIAAPLPTTGVSLDGSAGLKIAQQFDAIDEGPGRCVGRHLCPGGDPPSPGAGCPRGDPTQGDRVQQWPVHPDCQAGQLRTGPGGGNSQWPGRRVSSHGRRQDACPVPWDNPYPLRARLPRFTTSIPATPSFC